MTATLLIDGAWREGSETFERFDPACLERSTGRFAAASNEDVEAAYAAAAAAQSGWAATPAPQRGEVLWRAAEALEAGVEPASQRLTADIGKAIRDARAEVRRSAAILRYFAGELLQPVGETYASAAPDTMLLTVEEPLGVVCVITPWNFPFAIPAWKLAPAIAFGNAVVWKPAEAASGSAVALAQALAAAGLPPGVLNLVTGSARSISASLTGNPSLGALTFTGSGEVGAALRQAVADRNVKVQMELGGKNPAIVLADAELDDAALQVARGAMLSAGQRCTATSRVYVERAVGERFTALLAREIEGLVVGNPLEESTDVGPLGSVEQRELVAGYLRLAREERAEVIVGGAMGNDCFAEPTLLGSVGAQSALIREELFAPILVLVLVDDFDAALAAANDTDFGLASTVFTRDIALAMEFARGTQSGLVHVNRETAGVEPHVPFGGVKASSSLSREQGKAARQFFTASKTIYLRTPGRKANEGSRT